MPVEGGTNPSIDTPEDVAKTQRQLRLLQWAIPALTGAVLVLNARMGEQQRPAQVTKGAARPPSPRTSRLTKADATRMILGRAPSNPQPSNK